MSLNGFKDFAENNPYANADRDDLIPERSVEDVALPPFPELTKDQILAMPYDQFNQLFADPRVTVDSASNTATRVNLQRVLDGLRKDGI